ncbi:hypothetical protein RRF77_24815, partial [Escherichia coli]|nr:hypothetical protein [Escherichia coli]
VSISVILFNSRFRSYGAQGVLKKHPFCGAFLVFWGFKFLSMNIGRSIGALGTTALSIVVSTVVTRLLEKKMK